MPCAAPPASPWTAANPIGGRCRLYAVDDAVVWDEKRSVELTALN